MVSAVRKEEVYRAPAPRKQQIKHRKPDDRTDALLRARGRLSTGLLAAVTILLMFATVGRYAQLSDNQIQIDRIQKAIEEEQTRAQQLSLDISRAQDIGAIEQYARAGLGMEYGDRASVTYVDLPEERPKTQYAQAPKGQGLFAMLAQLLD